MSIKRRLDRLEFKDPPFYASADVIPTPLLATLVRKAYWKGNHSPEETDLFCALKESGFSFKVEHPHE